jgi:tetratricopeptide (TPR) repeat protein
MPAHLTPQEAVIRFKRAPADCDIVIVILWGRLGTHLDPASLVRPDGNRFLSGTEWEYENAFNASPRPDILVYQRLDDPPINLRGSGRAEALEQFDRVDAFVGRFKNADGSWKGGFAGYKGFAAFKKKLANDLEHLVAERLRRTPASAGPADPVPALPRAAAVATVPLPDRCLGRDDDTNALVTALTAANPHIAVLVQGPGGIGKTTLTQQAANDDAVVARFGARRWFVELETATDRDTFDTAILLALGLDATQGFDPAISRLAQERSLLILDNLETPWSGDPVAIEQRLARLAAVPGLALLASFRGDEAVGGARWSLRHTVHPLSPDDAKTLFLDIAQQIPGDDPHLLKLLAAQGGVPLAICLTARRAAHYDRLGEVWTEWQAAGTALARLPGAIEGRLTSVPQSIEFSLRSPHLTEAGRRLFRLLGQLPAGIADDDRRELLGGDAFTAREQVQGVGLAFMRAGRLDLLPPVRDHARRVHPPAGSDEVWFRHYLTLTTDLGPRVGRDGGAEALERLIPELPNSEAAMDAAIKAEELAAAAAARFGMSRVLCYSGLGAPRVLELLAHACASAGDVGGQASCLDDLGDVLLARSDHDAARSRYEEALPLYRRVGDVLGEANCIASLGDIALRRSDHDARSRYEEALPLYRRVGAVLGEANCIRSLGDIALDRSDHDAARTAFEQALPLFRQVGNSTGEGICLAMLGRLTREMQDPPGARTLFLDALTLFQRVQDVRNCAVVLEDLASVTTATERDAHLHAARAAWADIGLPHEIERLNRKFG